MINDDQYLKIKKPIAVYFLYTLGRKTTLFLSKLQVTRRQRGRMGKGVVFSTTLINDLGSIRTLVTLLRPWITRFTMIISFRWLQART